jgi:MYXO-CTERM domain-containing protein
VRMALQQNQAVNVTLDATNFFKSTIGADDIASFSSRGPRSEDGVLKPDIAAPGVSIDSAGVATGTDPRQNSGTSMACPMVAGAAALVRQAHPTWDPRQVKAAMMNSVVQVKTESGQLVPVSQMGAGRMKVDQAVLRNVYAAAEKPVGGVSVSFGTVVTSKIQEESRTVVVTNTSDQDVSYEVSTLSTYPLDGVIVDVEPKQVTVPAQGTANVSVKLTVDPSKLPEEKPDPATDPMQFDYARHFLTEAGGHVVFTSAQTPSEDLKIAFHGVVRAASEHELGIPTMCSDMISPDSLSLSLLGTKVHPSPVVSAFELKLESEPLASTQPAVLARDILAVGVANNVIAKTDFNEASVYFGVAINGEWRTPAPGSFGSSLLGGAVVIAIDVNDDQEDDFWVIPEALGASQQFATDVLIATTYNLKNQQPVSLRFLNIYPRDQANTEPFNNSVVVYPVTLSELGLTQNNAMFKFRALTYNDSGTAYQDSTDYAEYDPTNTILDSARLGENGIPIFQNFQPTKLYVDPQARAEGTLPKLLVLHHQNVAGKRMQIVDLNKTQEVGFSNLVVTQSVPEQAVAGGEFSMKVTVTNQGPAPAPAVVVQSKVGAAKVALAKPSQGTCTVTDTVSCMLGDLAPQGQVTISLSVQAPAAGTLVADSQASATGDCETQPGDNSSSNTVTITSTTGAAGQSGASAGSSGSQSQPEANTSGVQLGGGCNCSLPGGKRSSSMVWGTGLVAGLALYAGRRRSKKRAQK